ncbi:MAG: lipid A export permease/ATP-binding protein MsbA [Betaproteobacteria bacterium]|nr:MAG: lipid A export permease/ATP-binding protein MsbA [Betaproteobacteria bacterium]
MSPSVLLYRRLLSYVRPYWWAFALAVVGMIIVAAGDVLMAYMVMPIVQKLQHPEPETTLELPLAVVAVFLLRGIGSFMSEYGMAWTGHRVVFDLRKRMIDHLLMLPTPYYDAQSSGRLISKFTFDAYQLAAATSSAITTAVRSALTIAGSIAFLFWLNWQLTLIAIVVLPLVAAVTRYFSRRLRRVARDVQQRTGSITQALEEIVGGQRVVKIFGGQDYERRRAVAWANRLRQSMSKQSSASAASSPIMQFVAACAVGVIVYIMLKQSETGGFDAGPFAAYVIALLTLLDRLRSLSGVNANIQRGLAAAESIFGLLDEKPEEERGLLELPSVRGELEFENVYARYAGAESDALAGITLKFAPGESVALVGPSGSGKTTLVNLIPRFYEPASGRILLDRHDIDALTLANLRSHIALVSQEIILFDDTVAANIAYGAMSKVRSDAIEQAASAAHALDFIRALPQGFDTIVGENGVRLSGGQRQRLAIARAILKDAPILVLDEATSALDSESERHVQAAMEALMRGRTTIVIAHRLSTIERVDRIVVLDAGRVVEQGTHQELLARNGLYAKLHHIQFAAAVAA